MVRRKSSALMLLVALVVSSMILQGCAAIGSLIPTILGVLGNSNTMGFIGTALGAASNIAGATGNEKTAETLGQASEVAQAVPGAAREVQQTVQRTRTVFNGNERTTRGELNDQGELVASTGNTAQNSVNELEGTTDSRAR